MGAQTDKIRGRVKQAAGTLAGEIDCRRAPLLALVAVTALMSLPASAFAAKFKVTVSGTQTVSVSGNDAMPFGSSGCFYNTALTAQANYTFKTTKQKVVSYPSFVLLYNLPITVGGNGTLTQTGTLAPDGSPGCAPTANLSEQASTAKKAMTLLFTFLSPRGAGRTLSIRVSGGGDYGEDIFGGRAPNLGRIAGFTGGASKRYSPSKFHQRVVNLSGTEVVRQKVNPGELGNKYLERTDTIKWKVHFTRS